MSTAGATPRLVQVAGSVGGFLEVHVVRRGVVVDITGAVVTATIDRGATGELIIDRALVVVDGPAGIARLYWQAGDLVNPGDVAVTYRAEVTVDGETQPVPLSFEVRPRLA